MAGTDIQDTVFTTGQNEGIERAVLPLPQLAALQNARYRKTGRLGKRYGHTALTSNIGGVYTLAPRAIGGGDAYPFAICDEKCAMFDTVANNFRAAVEQAPGLLQGEVSAFLPDRAYFPMPARDLSKNTQSPCSTCFCIGYLWTVYSYIDPLHAGDRLLRVVAVDPTTQSVVYQVDISPATFTFGGLQYPKLIACGSTVILVYDYGAAAGHRVYARKLTTLLGGFSAEVQVSAQLINSFDASPYNSTQFLVMLTTGAANFFAYLVDIGSLTPSVTVNPGVGGAVTTVSIVGDPAVGIFCGYTYVNANKVAVYTAAFGALTGTAFLSVGTDAKMLMAVIPATSATTAGVRVVFETQNTVSTLRSFIVDDVVASTAAVVGVYRVLGYEPVSLPFAIGPVIYMWCREAFALGSGFLKQTPGVMLIRLPTAAEFTSTALNQNVNCPIEMRLDDFPVGNSSGSFDLSGCSPVVQVGTTGATYAVLVPVTYAISSSTITLGYDFRVLQVRHNTEQAEKRGLVPLSADGVSFVPMGALQRVDGRGAVEEGFAHDPAITVLVPAAGGALTASTTYYYTAVFTNRGVDGRYEQSAPGQPVAVNLGAGQTQVTLTLAPLCLTAKPGAQIEIYRTLSNGQTFYLIGIISASKPQAGAFPATFLDQQADTAIRANKALYTQVGNTLPNAFPPASRFGCVGGQRLILGGLMRPDVAQASKLIFGDQSPTFCDSDAFKMVVPADLTGCAYMDGIVLFTKTAIYLYSGDGPTDDGVGDFGNQVRLPYQLGCIEPRSVITTGDGTYFQSQRGLYMLPRGFGDPIPAGDTIQDTLALYPTITGCCAQTKGTEQVVFWTCMTSGVTPTGVRICYDIAHKAWSVDYLNSSDSAPMAIAAVGNWVNNEVAMLRDNITRPESVSVTAAGTFADAGSTPISIQLETGDLRPFGVISEGTISKVDALAELRSACTLNIAKITEWGSSASSRVFALAAGDYAIGNLTVTETELGASELREAMSVRIIYGETSATEGLAFVALAVEHEQGKGLKRVSDLSRNT